jgi:hypothetical protein
MSTVGPRAALAVVVDALPAPLKYASVEVSAVRRPLLPSVSAVFFAIILTRSCIYTNVAVV